MFKPKNMKKVRLIVLKSIVEKLIKNLHEIGLIDIRKTKYEGLDDGRPLPNFDEFSNELVKLRAVMSLMHTAIGKKETIHPKVIDGKHALEMAKRTNMGDELKNLNHEANKLTEAIKNLENDKNTINKIIHLKDIDFSKLSTRKIDYKIGESPPSRLLSLKSALETLGKHLKLITVPDNNTILVLYEKKIGERIEQILTDNAFNDLEIPKDMATPHNALTRVMNSLEENKLRLKDVQKKMLIISKENIGMVKNLIVSLEVEANRSEIASRFSSSKSIYVIEGWVIGSEYDKIEKIVHSYGNQVILQDVSFGHDDTPPTVLDNPKIANPMEFITKSYSMPNYFEIDPTMMYLIALPILYGMIVGDVIYGIISAILAYFLMNKFKKSYIMSNVSKIWFYSSIPTVIFGVIFDEWAGMSHLHLAEYIHTWTGIEFIHEALYHGLHRMENILILIGISALMGMIHLAAGFAIGAINEWEHNRKHSFAKLAWIGVEVGIILALGPQLGLLPSEFTMAGLVVLGLSVIIIGFTEGIIGIIEIPGFTGNILSYSRIAAVGIAGVVIAELLNEFLIPLPTHGVMAVIMIPIFIILHILNCFVAMFEALIQGGRLNIVEFRSKFLHGGGDVFIPFALYKQKL